MRHTIDFLALWNTILFDVRMIWMRLAKFQEDEVKNLPRSIVLILVVIAIVVAVGRVMLIGMNGGPIGGMHATVRRFLFHADDSIKEWDEKALSRHKTIYSITEHKGKKCVRAVGENSASTLYFKKKLSYDRRPFVSWDWIVEKFPERKLKETLDRKKEFDFAAQVYVVFQSRFFPNARAIQYVWAEGLPVGMVSDSPYTGNVKLIVLESGPSEEWKHEERDIALDFRNLFGEDLKKNVDAVAFMTDADSTKTSAVAYYGDITLGFLGPVAGKTSGEGSSSAGYLRWLSKIPFFRGEQKEEPSNI